MHAHEVLDSQLRGEALRQVLESQTFSRSEQLRSFLKYVCEKTVLGQAAEIKEYSIGVEALGRSPDYSPADDSSVRRRAYEIRQRLKEFYASEMPDAKVRIELPKGSYIPLFLEREPETVPLPLEPVPDQPLSPSNRGRLGWIVTALAAGLLIGSLTVKWTARPESHLPVDPIVKEFWGPIIAPRSNALICLGSPLYMVVRSAPFPNSAASLPAPEEIYGTYRQLHPLAAGGRLFMHPLFTAAPVGAINAIAEATGTLRLAGATYQILPERTAPLPSFRGRNVILFGDALTSEAAAKLLDRAYLTIGYDASGARLVIRDRRKPPSAEPAFSRKEESSSAALEAYGLITVLPTDGSRADGERTFVISGVSDSGIHGAMEFLTSPERLRRLKERFARQGLRALPAAYQVVVKCTASSSLLLSYEYAAHEVIDSRATADAR